MAEETSRDSVLVCDDELRQDLLYVRHIADNGYISEKAPLCSLCYVLYFRHRVPGNAHVTPNVALEHADRGLVKIDAQRLLTVGHFPAQVIVLPPSSEGLRGGREGVGVGGRHDVRSALEEIAHD